MTVRGYTRVSTGEQNPGRQIQSLKEAVPKFSIWIRNRPELERMMEELEPGDEVIIHEMSRFSRSVTDTDHLVKEIRGKGATLRSLTEPWLTADDSPQSELLMNIFSSLAQFERKMALQRQREGIEIAKKKGVYKGRPAKYTKNNARVRVALEEFAKGTRPVREICELYGISRETLYRVAEKEGIQRGNHS
ncbi:resolvase [Desmospora sp. 8437]|nr:resolvase [Desmospora sp. 8437]